MALQTINLGSTANDGTGDDLREAFEKVIFNFADLDARSPEQTSATNLGAGAGIFAGINTAELQFKSLVGGSNVTLTPTTSSITIDVDAGVTQFVVAADNGSLTVTESTTFTIEGGTLITTERDGNSIRINSSALSKVEDDPTPRLANGLDANGNNLGNVGIVTATNVNAGNMVVYGSLTGLVHDIDIRNLNEFRLPENSWNFGSIANFTVTNLWDYMWATVNVDFGSLAGTQSNVTLDLGSINVV